MSARLPGTRAEPQCAGDEVIKVHRGGQGQHVPAFLVGDGHLGVGEHAGDVLEGQAVLAYLDEVVQQPIVLAVQPVIEPDEQAVQPPGQVFVVGRIQGTIMACPCARLVAVQVMPQAAQERLVAAVAVIDGVEQLIAGQLARVGEGLLQLGFECSDLLDRRVRVPGPG